MSNDLYVKKEVVKATQWHKMGDHSDVTPNTTQKDNQFCKWCQLYPLSIHGVLETRHAVTTVCPGDWIIDPIDGFSYKCENYRFDEVFRKLE